MARRRTRSAPTLSFDALTVEGGLIAPAMLARIAAHQADGQSEADYGVPKGLTLRDEIARYFRIGQALFASLKASETPSHVATVKFVEELLRDVFGFADLKRVGSRTLGERQFTVTLEGLSGRVPIVVVPPSDELDRPSDHLPTDGRKRSAASAIQDWLNASDDCRWGLCSNGFRLRLVRDNQSLTRPAFIEADLRTIFEEENFADFTALWLLVHASRFGRPGTPPTDCALERWREAGQKEGVAARDRLRDGVEAALLSLGNGFLAHPDNGPLREKLHRGELLLSDYFGQLLRLVYRLIFLLAAEDRDLLHPPGTSAAARKLYAQGYSLASLRAAAVRRTAWDRHHDRWEGLKITFTSLMRGEKRLGLPALGGLFGPGTLPDLENAKLANRALMEAIYRLAWLKDDSGLVPVNWRDMETEELGSVYESLLELTPQLNGGGRKFQFAEGGEAKGHARKTTGSYYTPDSLVQALLDSALDPVLDRIEAEAGNQAVGSRQSAVVSGGLTREGRAVTPGSSATADTRLPPTAADALLGVRVLDPACGSGHFLLAAARRIATRLAKARTQGLASPADYRHALRDVVRACIHGVDRNPMAVELTKVALWIETVEPGKPLGFLDANIRCGDSLLGVFDLKVLEQGIPDAAYKPLSGDDKKVARHYAQKNRREKAERERIAQGFGFNRQRDLMRDFAALRQMPEDTPDEIAAKAARLKALTAKGATGWTLGRACDLYVAAFLAPKVVHPQTAGPDGLPRRGAETVPTSGTIWELLRGVQPYGLLVQEAERALEGARPFHWPLEFPDVMAGGPGSGSGAGFDVVLGNPPWEVMQLGEEEYFAQRLSEIAQLAGAARKRAIAALEKEKPAVYAAYQADKRRFEAVNEFARESGRFDLTARGKINTYALFAELFSNLASYRGRAGVIVPAGLTTDYNSSFFFRSLVSEGRLIRSLAFDNQKRIFPAVHPDTPFTLLTMGRSDNPPEFASYLLVREHLDDPNRRYRLNAEDIARINPNTKTAPVFRSKADAELTAKIYARVPVLVNEAVGSRQSAAGTEIDPTAGSRLPTADPGNPWGVEFRQGLFNMTSDSGLFRTAAELAEAGYVREGSDWVKGAGSRQSAVEKSNPTADARLPTADAERYVPLYEAKMISFYDHRAASYSSRGDERGYRVLPETTLSEHQDPYFEVEPFYWVPESEVTSRLVEKTRALWLLGWKDVTSATNERTTIFSAIPRCGVAHTMPLLFSQKSPERTCVLYGNLNSIAADYFARLKVAGLHLTYGYLKQYAILPPETYGAADLAFIVPRVLELTYTSWSMKPFADDIWQSAVGSRQSIIERWVESHGGTDQVLSRLAGLAAGHGADRASVPTHTNMAEGGTVRIDEPSPAGSGVDPRQHRRRIRETEPRELREFSDDRTRVPEGAGNLHSARGADRPLAAEGDRTAADPLGRPRPRAGRLDPQIVSRLTTADCRLPPFKWDEDRRAIIRAELDAWYARAYGLTRDELRYILDPADVKGSDYPSETFRVLKQNEIKKYGEYRTARLVLQAWDQMERGEL